MQQFQKEAIYRRMREAQRDATRARDDAAALEAAHAQAQDAVLAVNRFWEVVRGAARRSLDSSRSSCVCCTSTAKCLAMRTTP